MSDEANKAPEKGETGGKHELVFLPNEKTAQRPEIKPISRGGRWFKSIRFNLWIIFILMTVVMLAILWVYEFIFYSASYTANAQNELMKEGREFSASYTDLIESGSDPLGYVNSFARAHQVNIVVFSVDISESGGYTTEVLQAQSSVTGTAATAPEGRMLSYYMQSLGTSYAEGRVFNTVDAGFTDDALVVYGIRLVHNSEPYYIYMSATLPAFTSAQNTIGYQLLIISGAFLVIAVVVAFFASSVAARPIRTLTQKVVGGAGGGKREPLATDTRITEINELSSAINKAFEDVENNNRFRRDLLANVSHDMKTPLTMIRAYSEMIRDISGGNKEKCARQAQIIIDETDRLTALIGEVVELSKLESGIIELNYSVFDISVRLRETVGRFRIMEETKGYDFDLDVPKELSVRADSERIDRVIYNLIGNAMNYTGADKKVKVRCYADGNLARVEISDTGKGMTEEELATVWEKYYRLAQDKRNVIGSGLGLSIVKSILDLHGVTYGVASEKNVGSTFWFTLPLEVT